MHKKKKFIVIPFIFSFLIVLAVSLYANRLISFSMDTMEYNIEHRLIAESKRLANMVSSKELDKYRSVHDMELPEYQALRQQLFDFSREADVLYVYYIRPTDSGLQYIVDNDFNEETRVGLDTPPFDPLTVPWIVAAQQGQAVCSGLGNYNAGWEGLLSGYAPVFDESGKVTAIAGVDVEDMSIVQAWRLVSILTVVQFITAAAIFVSGIIYLIYLYRQLEIAREASSAKSDFLAKMSHEIRTPMNAITGMAELALREEMPQTVQGHILTIRQAGENLLSIINDILDFSKIEAGKLELNPVKYVFSSLIDDTVNIIRTRIMEKPLRFYTNIEGNIPNNLIGDQARLRQILLNLLSNAVKYSEKGHIGLTITVDKRDNKQIRLRIAVADTGKGIKPEDQAKLFDEFVQVDTKKSQNVEGTGLGLAITKRLCMVMGGDISVESEYGKGSIFTAVIPQSIESETPFAAVEEPEKKKVLVYEGRFVYARSVCWTLDNMGVPHTMVTNQDDFAAALCRGPQPNPQGVEPVVRGSPLEEWSYVFSGYGLYNKIEPVMKSGTFPGGKKPPLALMVEWGTEAFIPGVRFVSIPVQSLSIANVLNGRADNKDFIKSSGSIRFTFPDARLLVVDDIATNLKVVGGLLEPYKTAVDICMNGPQAIELVKHNEYDIVFMDHMMPGMDGIETTRAIRAWEKEQQEKKLSNNKYSRRQTPIIALTANAVVGMREMFIENGFNDFVSKPIDVSKLDEMLNAWIPEDKRKESIVNRERGPDSDSPNCDTPLPDIPGVDKAKGIAATGGTEAGYRAVLSTFSKDAESRLSLLQTTPEEDTLSMFTTQVHALKSACASIGAADVSSLASNLEIAGRITDLTFISEHLSAFTQQLAELVRNIEAALKIETPKNQDVPQGGAASLSTACYPLFRELAEALKKQNTADIDRIIAALGEIELDSKTKEALEKISNDALMAEFDNALKIIDSLIPAQAR